MSASKLSRTDVWHIMRMRGAGYHTTEIAKKFGVSQATISHLLIVIRKSARSRGARAVWREVEAGEYDYVGELRSYASAHRGAK